MALNYENEIRKGIETSFINSTIQSNLAYRPEFLSNDYKSGKKVISTIEQELSKCDEFLFSVAFITQSGVQLLLQTLKELEAKGIKGKILTTDYLTFSQPKALDKLNSFSNVELRMFFSEENNLGFHTKGYIFRTDNVYRMIIGSSNLTQNALSENKEWNTKLISTESGQFAEDVISEFNSLWENKYTKKYNEFIDIYREKYRIAEEQKKLTREQKVIDVESYKLSPNKMQTVFVQNLSKLVNSGENKALLVSATATGKTYASAFGMREIKANKVLFIVHRETISKQARESFQKVFGKTKSFGSISGNVQDDKQFDKEFIFATMQMMSKEKIMQKFAATDFDAIIIDEVHRAGSDSYQKIMSYFKPNLWLGMTASPERTDGFDIFDLFDHNIAYEIRLQQALEYDLLCPFHYFGITDLEVNGETIDDNSEFSKLVCDERVKHIIEKINFYGYYGNRAKGLIFCSRKEEARELSREFNKRGYKTVALTGEDSQEKREEYMELLESDNEENYLEYIFTVDIFNEGVDIPKVNQIVMLRSTQSPIIFVQQLGRGLRKAENKEYVVVLDFVGNYSNNYMIPIALSGDRSYNKDNLRRYLNEGTRIIPGCSTIHFDEITKKRIYESIDNGRFNAVELIKTAYFELKMKLGCIPTLIDFIKYESIDPQKIFDKMRSYHRFLKKYEKGYTTNFTETQEKYIDYISTQFLDGKRIQELLVLKLLIDGTDNLFEDLNKLLEKYDIKLSEELKMNLVNIFTSSFITGTGSETYADCVFIEDKNNKYVISDVFKDLLNDIDFKNEIENLIEYGITRHNIDYSNTYKDSGFQLYSKYSYHDVCRMLNWQKSLVSLNIGGYKYDATTNTYPIFINYEKSDNVSDTIKYEDRFINNTLLSHISKNKKTLKSNDVLNFLNADEKDTKVELFVRKNKDDKESKEFYYLGRVHPRKEAKEIIMQDGKTKAVRMTHKLEVPVRDDIFDYITEQD